MVHINSLAHDVQGPEESDYGGLWVGSTFINENNLDLDLLASGPFFFRSRSKLVASGGGEARYILVRLKVIRYMYIQEAGKQNTHVKYV